MTSARGRASRGPRRLARGGGERAPPVRLPARRALKIDPKVGEIVGAYDKAVGDVIGQLVAWTQANAS